jgi:GTP cyclohydrolase III
LANTKYSYAIKKVGKKAIKGTEKIVSGTAKTAKKSAIKTKRAISKIRPKRRKKN